MKFKLPWKSSSLFIIFLLAIPFFSPSRVQSILGVDQGILIIIELTLVVFGAFNFLVMFNPDVVSDATFRETYGLAMYILYWLVIVAVFILACLVVLGD